MSDLLFAMNDLSLALSDTSFPSNYAAQQIIVSLPNELSLQLSNILLLMLSKSKFVKNHFPNIHYEVMSRICLPSTFLNRSELYLQISRGIQCDHYVR